ncbi:hypothetical protein ACLOJK_031237 [Asimina triloba]
MPCLVVHHPRPFLHRSRPKLPTTAVHASSSLHQVETKSPPAIETIGGSVQPELLSSVAFPAIAASKRVVLVRHGQSTWNEEGRIQGSSDYAVLTQKGEAQAETSRQMLLADTFHVCFHSPLIRSKKTAEIIWSGRAEEMIPEFDLREIDLYSFQGLFKHEGKAKFGEAYRQWQKDAANFNIDGHYPVRELWSRARNCWNEILQHEGKSVLVVAHNAVNQALVATAIGIVLSLFSFLFVVYRLRGRNTMEFSFKFLHVKSGLGTKYFRILLQSNCGVSVLDFNPQPEGGSPKVSRMMLLQTPNSPIAAGSSAGRKTSKRIVLVCYGATENSSEVSFLDSGDVPMNMLGVIQSQKTAELLLDLNVSSIICSPRIASINTAAAISKVQEAADCLGADCVPRYVEIKQMQDLEDETADASVAPMGWFSRVEDDQIARAWDQAGKAWKSLLSELSDEPGREDNLVAVAHPAVHVALIGHCLNLTVEWMGAFHLDSGSITVIDFPEGPAGSGVVRCINYTAHLGRWSIPVTRSTVDDEDFHAEATRVGFFNNGRPFPLRVFAEVLGFQVPTNLRTHEENGGSSSCVGRPKISPLLRVEKDRSSSSTQRSSLHSRKKLSAVFHFFQIEERIILLEVSTSLLYCHCISSPRLDASE